MLTYFLTKILPYLPKRLVWQFSKEYIAGETLDEVLRQAKMLDSKGIVTTIDVLGEFISNLRQAEANRDEYLQLIERAHQAEIQGNYSVKPTFFGLLLDPEECFNNLRAVVEKAASFSGFIRIDMEDSHCTQPTIDLFRRLKNEFSQNVGLVLQAYLRRTAGDLQDLRDLHSPQCPLNLRICKGIYVESPTIAYREDKEIRQNYLKLIDSMMKHSMYPAIATHDIYLVEESLKLIQSYGYSTQQYEFQMLFGVTPKLRQSIVDSGHLMRVYLPFGRDWFGYSMRRLQENPNMVKHIVKALFIRQ